MTAYQLATTNLGSVYFLLFILMASAAAHGWGFIQLAGYARVLGRNGLWWALMLGFLGSAVGLWLQMTVIFTDQAPPLRVGDFLSYGAQLVIVIVVVWYIKSRRLTVQLNTHKRRVTDHA